MGIYSYPGWTQLGSGTTITAPVPGDTFKLEYDGTDLIGYRNDVEETRETRSGGNSTGSPGFNLYKNTSGPAEDVAISSWTGTGSSTTTVTQTHTTDAALKEEKLTTHDTDAWLTDGTSTVTETHTTDAALKEEKITTHTTDARLQGAYKWPWSVSSDGRRFVGTDNEPVFFIGDTAWHLSWGLMHSGVDFYLDNRVSKGFNAIYTSAPVRELYDEDNGGLSRANYYGELPFDAGGNDDDWAVDANPEYWNMIESGIKMAEDKGITVFYTPTYLGFFGQQEGWNVEIAAQSIHQMKDWGEYIANRLSAYNNIIWAMGTDVDPGRVNCEDKIDAVVSGILNILPNALITGHGDSQDPVTGNVSSDYAAFDKSWLSYNYTYSYLTNVANEVDSTNKRAWDDSPTKPYIYIEGQYELSGSNEILNVRGQAYAAMLEGAAGQFMGVSSTAASGDPAFYNFQNNWQNLIDTPASFDMTHLASVAKATFVPDWDNTIITGGKGTIDSNPAPSRDYVPAAITEDGRNITAYTPSQKALTIELSSMDGTSAVLQWMNADTGVYSGISTVSTADQQILTPPDTGDWVFLADIEGALTTTQITVDSYLSANVVTITQDHTSDTALLSENSFVHTSDSLLLKEVGNAHTSDTTLSKEIIYNNTSDSLLFTESSVTHTIDAHLKEEINAPHTTDSTLKEEIKYNYTSDSHLLKETTAKHLTDSSLKGEVDYTLLTDAELSVATWTRSTIDAALLTEKTTSNTSDSLLGTARIGPDQTTILRPESDDVVQLSSIGASPNYNCINESKNNNDTDYVQAGTFGGVDVTLSDIYNVSNPGISDSFLAITNVRVSTRARYSGELSIAIVTPGLVINGNVHNGGNNPLTPSYVLSNDDWAVNPDTGNAWTWEEIDALKLNLKVRVKDLNLGITGRVTQQYITVTYHQVTLVEETNYHTTTDANIVNRSALSSYTDAALSIERESTHFTDTYLSLINKKTSTVDAVLAGIPTVTHTTDSSLKGTTSESHTSDTSLVEREFISHTSDTVLATGKTANHYTDCLLDTFNTTGHTTDALLIKENANTYTTDAELTGAYLTQYTSDCALAEEHENTHTTDCTLKGAVIQTHTNDTILYGTNSHWEIYDNLTSPDGTPYEGVTGRANRVGSGIDNGRPLYSTSDANGKISWTFPAGVTVYIFIREAGLKKTIVVPTTGIASSRIGDL
jgi:hypothetical protein